MNGLVLPRKLEELLVANWAHVLDAKRVMALVLQCVRDAQLPHVEEDEVPLKGSQVSISRFEWHQEGFLVWVDFSVPVAGGSMAVGTTELVLTPGGEARHRNTIGSVFVRRVRPRPGDGRPGPGRP
jgi:hypothetical protein